MCVHRINLLWFPCTSAAPCCCTLLGGDFVSRTQNVDEVSLVPVPECGTKHEVPPRRPWGLAGHQGHCQKSCFVPGLTSPGVPRLHCLAPGAAFFSRVVGFFLFVISNGGLLKTYFRNGDIIHPFKVYNLVVLNALKRLCSHRHSLVAEHVHCPEGNPVPWCWEPSVYLLSLWIFLLRTFHRNGITCYMSFCAWLLSLSVGFPGSFVM